MASNIVGYFDDYSQAKQTEQELMQAGFGADEIKVVRGDDRSTHQPNAWEEFKSWFGFASNEDRSTYEEAARRGGTLLSVRTAEGREDIAAAIIQRHDPVDLDTRAAEWRGDATTGSVASEQIDTRTTRRNTAAEGERTEAIPVTEEQLRVGKRAVQRGGVRIHKHVVEQPVQESVELRDEEVHVQRRKVDRPVSDADDAFRDRTIEVTETDEEAVVSKEARVREEIEVSKDVTQRREEIRDTVRKEEVDVERVDAGAAGATTREHGRDYDRGFREDFDRKYARTGATYDHYRPAYEYGHRLGQDQRLEGRDWNDIEPEARRQFETSNPDTWPNYRDAVRHGFMTARQNR